MKCLIHELSVYAMSQRQILQQRSFYQLQYILSNAVHFFLKHCNFISNCSTILSVVVQFYRFLQYNFICNSAISSVAVFIFCQLQFNFNSYSTILSVAVQFYQLQYNFIYCNTILSVAIQFYLLQYNFISCSTTLTVAVLL